MVNNKKHIVVIGGGFAGIEAAIGLRKKGYLVTLVSNRGYMFIYPISIWIPTNRISFNDATLNLDMLSKRHGFNLVLDEFAGLDMETNKVVLKKQELQYDYLILASGAAKVQHQGIEHTLSICGDPDQSVKIRERFDAVAQKGGNISIGFGGNPKDQSAVRGGPAFELMFNLMHELKRRKNKQKVTFTFFSPMAEPGRRMGEKGYNMLLKMFRQYGIERHVGKKIKHFEPDGIVFEDDSRLSSDLTLFIPASSGPKYLAETKLPMNEAGFIKIDENCKVEGSENIYAVGDIAALAGPDWRAKQGHIAVIMAKTAIFNIHQELQGKSKKKEYISHVNIICVMDTGNGAAIVYRKGNNDFVLPLPIVGHWLKIAWGMFYKWTKR